MLRSKPKEEVEPKRISDRFFFVHFILLVISLVWFNVRSCLVLGFANHDGLQHVQSVCVHITV